MGDLQRNRSGFTLIELSIVLVIIGLVVGGVLAGQALIRQAQLMKINSKIESYKVAVNAFRNKYNGLPGDVSGMFTVAGGDVTIDGNGNGVIDDRERFEFWHHLSLAGMIADNIPGASGNSANQKWDGDQIGGEIPGEALPQYENWGFHFYCTIGIWAAWGAYYGDSLLYNKDLCFVYFASGTTGGALSNNWTPSWSALSRDEAHQFDMKFDDGIPSSGNVMAIVGSLGYPEQSCVNGNWVTDPTSTYKTGSDLLCILIFPMNIN